MIDHKVIWPEIGFEMTITQEEDSDGVQRTIQSYSDSAEDSERSPETEEMERLINESTMFRRFVIGLSFIQRVVRIVIVGSLAVVGLALVEGPGIQIIDPNSLFWALLASTSIIVVLDSIIGRVLYPPTEKVSIYAAGIIAFLGLYFYFRVKQSGANVSRLFEYSTAPASTKVLLEELVMAGRRFGP